MVGSPWLMSAVVDEVRRFCRPERGEDVTMIVGKGDDTQACSCLEQEWEGHEFTRAISRDLLRGFSR